MSSSTENYRYYKALHRCVNCHKQDAYTLNGRSYCFECAERFRAYNQKYRDNGGESDRQKRRKEERAKSRADHVCVRCGKPLPKGSPYAMCDKHRAYFRNHKRAEVEKKRGYSAGDAQRRMQYGLCFFCGKPVKEGFTTYGTRFKVCDEHYNTSMSRLAKAQQVNAAKYGGRHAFIDSCMVSVSKGGAL